MIGRWRHSWTETSPDSLSGVVLTPPAECRARALSGDGDLRCSLGVMCVHEAILESR